MVAWLEVFQSLTSSNLSGPNIQNPVPDQDKTHQNRDQKHQQQNQHQDQKEKDHDQN